MHTGTVAEHHVRYTTCRAHGELVLPHLVPNKVFAIRHHRLVESHCHVRVFVQALFHLAEGHIAATIRPVLRLVQMEELEKWLQPDLPQNLTYGRKEAQHRAGFRLINGAAHGDGFRRSGSIW